MKKMICLLLFIHPLVSRQSSHVVSAQGWYLVPVLLEQPCSALPWVPHTHLPSWPAVACVAGSPVRGRWGRLSRWCVEGAGDGSGHPGGPRAAEEMPHPCSSETKSKQELTSWAPSPRGVALRGLLAPSSICPLSSVREPGTCLQHPAPSHPFCLSPPPGAWAVGSASSCRGQVVALHPLTSPYSRWARQGPASGKAEP